MSERYVSFNPETFVDGGGLVDDSDGTFTNFRWMMADLRLIKQGIDPTKGGNPTPYLHADMEVNGETYENWWSAGGSQFYEPSADGKQLKAKSTATGIRQNSNVGIFFESLANCGYPPDRMGEDISVLDGIQAHFLRVPEPDRKGLKRPVAEPGREKTVLTFTKIIKMPWETGKKAASKGKAPAAADGLDEEVVNMILTSLADNHEGVAKKELIKQVVSGFDSSKKSAALKFVNDDTWLKERPEWNYEDGVVRLA